MVEVVISGRIFAVIADPVGRAIEVGTGIGDVEIGDLALDRQRDLGEFVFAKFLAEAARLQIVEFPLHVEHAVVAGILVHDRGRDRPILVEVDLERGATAIGARIVEILFDDIVIVDAEAVLDAADCDRVTGFGLGIRIGFGDRVAAIGPRPGHIVDETRIALIKSAGAERHAVADRQVDHAFQAAAHAAVRDLVDLAVDAPAGDAQFGLVGDDADGAGLARRAIQRALRPGEALDPGDVIDVDVERPADGRDRLFVEVGADRRERARVVAVAAGGDAAHIDHGRSRLRSLEADRRQLLGIILEIRDVELVELAGPDRLDADRHVLQVFLPLGRGDDDFVGLFVLRSGLRRRIGGIGRSCLLRHGRHRQRGGSKQRHGQRAKGRIGHVVPPQSRFCVLQATPRA